MNKSPIHEKKPFREIENLNDYDSINQVSEEIARNLEDESLV